MDRSTEQDCITGTPQSPTTPPTTTTTRQILFDLTASAANRAVVCRGNTTKIDIPAGYSLFPIDVYYGVTKAQQCKNIRYCQRPTIIFHYLNQINFTFKQLI